MNNLQVELGINIAGVQPPLPVVITWALSAIGGFLATAAVFRGSVGAGASVL